jgi:alkylation response protein AidB-like acyl-CoA dehydrogenase
VADGVEAFQRELVAWLDAADAPDPSDSVAWSKRLGERGLFAPDWPEAHGGAGLSREQVRVLEAELRSRRIRRVVSGGLTMLGPVLREFASDVQQARFLPPIARCQTMWAQGYSEPQAGSDLANVQMRAEDQGDHYLVNGQKIWTSGADQSDWIFCLVRTDPKASKHEGISFLLVDLRSEGIRIAPITLISGRSPFCEVFFQDVRVPKQNIVGKPGGGWPIAKRLLQFERSMLGAEGLASLTGRASRKPLHELACERLGTDEAGRLADPALRERLARFLVADRASKLTGRRARGPDAARVSSILKLVSSETNQQKYDVLMDLLGSDGLGWDSEGIDDADLSVTRQWLRAQANTIEGGTSEIQLNVIAKRLLGMPGQAGSPDQSLAADEERALIRDSALQFLREQDPVGALRGLRDSDGDGFLAAFWEEIQTLGWPGLLAPEPHGGAGLGFQELGVVTEALGRHLALAPLFSSAVLAPTAVTLAGGWDGLPKPADLVSGASRAALALQETARFDTARIDCVAEQTTHGYRLTGAKRSVLDGTSANLWLVLARLAPSWDVGLFAVPRDVEAARVTPLRWLDGRRAADLAFNEVALPKHALLGSPRPAAELLEPLVNRAAAVLACECVGIAARAFEITLAYLKTRVQFDQTLASLQALQHRMARAFTEIELALSLTREALRALDAGDDEASAAASAAKAYASETVRFVTSEALQLHGGLGMTEEQDIGLFFKRARVTSALFGDAAFHYDRFARLHAF